MESEEFEQIPWSGLVGQAQPAVDPRWYVAGGVVGAIVIAFLAMRLFTGASSAPPAPVLAADPIPVGTTLPVVVDAVPAEPAGSITEADLMAVESPIADWSHEPLVRFVAEWFVTDYFTRDGSLETVDSLKAALADDALAQSLPHLADSDDETFVEWARAFAFEYPEGDAAQVSVAFRTVHRGEDGFVRDPVRAVIIDVVGWETDPTVDGLPIDIDVP